MTIQLKDIAKYLNVSVSSVSKTINGTGRVGKETRERIMKAIEELGYQPNEVARSLKRKSANSLGVIVSDLSNPFYSKVIKGIESVASRNDHHVIVCNSNEDAHKEEEYVKLLMQNRVSGLIIASVGGNPKALKPYIRSGIPFVFIDNEPRIDEQYNLVTIDNIKASYELTQHLLDQGHRHLAIITGPLDQSTALERKLGFEKCLSDNGVTMSEQWVGSGEFKQASGYAIMKDWLKRDQLPTALFAANDFLLYGATKALYERGLRIPDDMAVACFDADDETGLIRPRLTSVVQPAYDIGAAAAEMIMRRKQEGAPRQAERIVLESSFRPNESSLKGR
ncbi:LacI family DNA-binding transcriptional regulator [Cohnella soli]|uniref:LacI family DNA-binding transcriptional regulator n=1 Tax=Cohnella soli TaxID=425005 RepID=A0ABW0HZW2_9BACL